MQKYHPFVKIDMPNMTGILIKLRKNLLNIGSRLWTRSSHGHESSTLYPLFAYAWN